MHIGGASETDISAADGSRVAGDAITASGRHMPSIGCSAVRALRPLTQIGPTMADVATAGAHRWMVHRIGHEARRCIDVAIAALDCADRNMRRCLQSFRGRPIVTGRTIGVARLVRIMAAGPARKIRSRACVASDAVDAPCCDMIWIRGRALRAFHSLAGIRPVMAFIASAGAHRWVVHRIGRKARRCIGVTIAALNNANWDVRRRL